MEQGLFPNHDPDPHLPHPHATHRVLQPRAHFTRGAFAAPPLGAQCAPEHCAVALSTDPSAVHERRLFLNEGELQASVKPAPQRAQAKRGAFKHCLRVGVASRT